MRYLSRRICAAALASSLALCFSAASAEDRNAASTHPIQQLVDCGLGVEYTWFTGTTRYVRNSRFKEPWPDYRLVESLRIEPLDAAKLTDEAISVLLRFPKLESVSLVGLPFDPDALRQLKSAANLRSLHFPSCDASIREANDLAFLEDLPHLAGLGLMRCQLTDPMLERLLPLQSLKTLDLSENPGITQNAFSTLRKLKSLESVRMVSTGVDCSRLEALRFAADVRKVDFHGTTAWKKPVEIADLVKLPRDLWDGQHPTGQSLQEIASLLPGAVRSIDSQYFGVRISGRDSQDKPFLLSVARRLTNDDVAFIGQLSEVRFLSIGDTNQAASATRITDEALEKLAGLTKLTYLALDTRNILTDESLKPLATLSALERAFIKNVQLGASGLDWLTGTPKLKNLTIRDGRIDADALARLSDAGNLDWLSLYDVVLLPSTKPLDGGAVTRLEFVSKTTSVAECRIIARFKSLKSLSLFGPVTDEHLEALAGLENLSELLVFNGNPTTGSRQPAPTFTVKGLLSLRRTLSPRASIQCNTLSSDEQQLIADQFGWTFRACDDIDPDKLPEIGVWATLDDVQRGLRLDAGVLQPLRADDADESNSPTALRLRGPIQEERLILRRQNVPSTAKNLYLTDCQVGELRFEGWLPKKITVWCDSRIDRITASGDQDEATTELHYRYLDDVTTLTVPASKQISRIAVHDCAKLETMQLVGFYPRLEAIDLGGLEQLKYLSTPHTGDAPNLAFPNDISWLAKLPSLRSLKAPGTKFKSALPRERNEYWPPKALEEVDLRKTPIDDSSLDGLATIPSLRILRIGQCENLTDRAVQAFRQKRPDVEIDMKTEHRPGQ